MSASSVSVVIPAYRAAGTISRAVASLLASIEPRNVVVALDGPDASCQAALAGYDGVRVVVSPTRRGAPVCRNLGLGLVETSHVMFLDADDYVEGPFLSAAAKAAQAGGADLVLGRFAIEHPDGHRETYHPATRYRALTPSAVMKDWLLERYTPPCAILWRAAFVRGVGGWDEALAKNQDGDLMYRALAARPTIAACSQGQGVYVQSDDPRRITNRFEPSTLVSQLAVLDKVRSRLGAFEDDIRPQLARAYYQFARLAYTRAADEVGVAAELAAHDLGLVGEPGALPHKLFAGLLGLKRKQRLARALRIFAASHRLPGARTRPLPAVYC